MVGNGPYVKVLKDLEKRRVGLSSDLERIQAEFAELDVLIVGIRKLAYPNQQHDGDVSSKDFVHSSPSALQPSSIKSMSMRWAILNIFGKTTVASMGVGDVLAALTESDFPVTAKTRGNISAVLSRMVSFGEVTNSGNSYAITDLGRKSLQGIYDRQKSNQGEVREILEAVRQGGIEDLLEGD